MGSIGFCGNKVQSHPNSVNLHFSGPPCYTVRLLKQALMPDPVVKSPGAIPQYRDWMFWFQREYLPEYN